MAAATLAITLSNYFLYPYPQKQPMATPAFTNSNNPLKDKIAHLIRRNGPIPFRNYMDMALFDEDHGYYTSDSQTVGKDGDFITSVSVGRCFGLILARRLIAFWQQVNMPSSFSIIEPWAHNGALCADILREIQMQSPEFFDALHYHLVEASDHMQHEQQSKLADDFKGKFSSHRSLSDIHADHGAVISNELIDAFPVDLIKFKDEKWQQLYVDELNGELAFTEKAIHGTELANFCQSLGNEFPNEYLTEFSPGIPDLAQQASAALKSGLMITIDYGYRAEDYYHPSRSSGTLQTYYQHQKSDDPLECPGELDITCHVDFCRITKALATAGFSNPTLSSQASYLTTHGTDWLIEIETKFDELEEAPALLRQFQTLTHPAMLGSKFMVLEMLK